MMKESDNLLAQHIFKTIGAEVSGIGTRASSEKAVLDFLKEAGVDVDGLSMADGCGLSVENRISTKQIGKFLAYMLTQKEKDDFISTMNKSKEITIEEINSKNIFTRMLEAILNTFAPLF